MRALFFFSFLFVVFPSLGQKKLYATVFDQDNNPVARGFFKSAADSGIIVLVDGLEVLVLASEISKLKIEKNPSKSEFLKLGTTAASEVVSYLINRPKRSKELNDVEVEYDSAITQLDSSGEAEAAVELEPEAKSEVFSTETKDALFQRLHSLLQDLLIGTNDLATFSINNSSEKFFTKLRLLQQYSMDKELVAWNDVADTEGHTLEIEVDGEPSKEQLETNEIDSSSSQENASPSTRGREPKILISTKPRTVTLIKGFHILSKPIKQSTSVSNTGKPPRQSGSVRSPFEVVQSSSARSIDSSNKYQGKSNSSRPVGNRINTSGSPNKTSTSKPPNVEPFIKKLIFKPSKKIVPR